MTFDQFLRIIKARWLLAGCILSVIVGLTLAISLLIPKTYEATAYVMADFKPDPVAGASQMMAGIQPVTYIATQVDLIKSPAIAARVVREAKLDQSEEMRERWKKETKGNGDAVAWMGEFIAKGLTVKPSRESNIIEVTYQSVSPQFATVLANTFTKAYLDTVLQIRVDPARQYYGFFEERARLAREKYENAQQKLADAQRANGIVVTEERLDAENIRLNEISTQIAALRAANADASTRSDQAKKRADQMQDVLGSPLIVTLKSDQSRAQARLEELSARMGDNHPQVIEARANFESVTLRLREETSRVFNSLNINSTMAFTRLEAANQAYEEQRAKLLKMKEQRNELQVLEREVESAQRIYEAIQARQSQMGLESNNNQNNITILQPATEPSSHTYPKLFLNLALALTVGTLFSIIAVLLAELFDRRIRGVQDLIQGTGLPVIGIMPSPHELGWSGRFLRNFNSNRRSIQKHLSLPNSAESARPAP